MPLTPAGTPIQTMVTPSSVAETTNTATGNVATKTVATKPGWKTSEFWMTLGLMVLGHLAASLSAAPGVTGAIAALVAGAIASAGYSISRGMAKSGGAS